MIPFMKSLLSLDVISDSRLESTLKYVHSWVTCCKRKDKNTNSDNIDNHQNIANKSCLFGEDQPFVFEPDIISYFKRSLKYSLPSSGLYFENKFLHYEDLDAKADCVSSNLLKLLQKHIHRGNCDQQNKIFAIDIAPSFDLIIAVIAVLRIGGTILPVDSHSAINRVKNILNECKPVCLIVDANSAFLKDTNDKIWSNFLIYDIDKTVQCRVDEDLGNIQRSQLNDIAAIIYTSGSTGLPKGVRLSHTTVLNRLNFQWTTFPFHPSEVGCFKTSILFVDSLVEIFSCILKQIPLVIVPKSFLINPENLVNVMEHHKVTRITVVPSLLRNLLYYLSLNGGGNRLPDLSLWISNSEKLTVELANKFFDIFPSKYLANFYGSTETMADVTYEVFLDKNDVLAKQKDENLSIGKPLPNCSVYIVDENESLLPKGSIGEICVSGLNLASFYMDRNNLAFKQNAILVVEGHSVLYHTGDYGRIVNDMIIYEGRRDMQVKISGQRVNISEIEKVIVECDSVKQTVVLCHKFSDISTVLVAYYVAMPGITKNISQSQITDACRKNLPPYMRPKLLFVRDIPLQPYTGKVDRFRLKKLYERAFKRQSTLDLITFDEKSQKVLNIIGMNLNIPPTAIPQKVSFSELGGDSVTMISTIVQLKQYNLHIPIDLFSEASTVQDIINLVTESDTFYQEPSSLGYTVKRLNEVHNSDQTIHLLADSFIVKDPLEVLLGITKEEFLPFATSLYQVGLLSGHSIVVLDNSTGQIVAGDFLFNLADRRQVNHHESMAPILSLLEKFQEPVLEEVVNQTDGCLMFNFCLFVHKDLQYSQQVKLCHLVEANVLQQARREGFVGVITNNTNPVTQDICEHFFGYKLLSQMRVADFVYNGRKVFAHAPQDYHLKMMLKTL